MWILKRYLCYHVRTGLKECKTTQFMYKFIFQECLISWHNIVNMMPKAYFTGAFHIFSYNLAQYIVHNKLYMFERGKGSHDLTKDKVAKFCHALNTCKAPTLHSFTLWGYVFTSVLPLEYKRIHHTDVTEANVKMHHPLRPISKLAECTKAHCAKLPFSCCFDLIVTLTQATFGFLV